MEVSFPVMDDMLLLLDLLVLLVWCRRYRFPFDPHPTMPPLSVSYVTPRNCLQFVFLVSFGLVLPYRCSSFLVPCLADTTHYHNTFLSLFSSCSVLVLSV